MAEKLKEIDLTKVPEQVAKNIEEIAKLAGEKAATEAFNSFQSKVEAFSKTREWSSGMGATPPEVNRAMDISIVAVKSGNNPVAYIPKAEIGKGEKTFANLGEFVRAVVMHDKRLAMMPNVLKAMGELIGSTGGFFIPYEFKPEVLMLIIESQVVRPRATVIPMATDTLVYPRFVDTSHVTSIDGGLTGNWLAEASDISGTTTDPAVGQVRLIAKKFGALIKFSNELLMDSPISIIPLINQRARIGIGFREDYNALWGNGANQMVGAFSTMNHSLVSVARAVTSSITYDDIVAMQAALFPSSYDKSVWVVSPSGLKDILRLSLAVGTGGSAVFITNVSGQTAAQSFPMTILGRPLIISEKMAALGSAGDIALADFSYYLIGDRMDLTAVMSDQRFFETDQTAIRLVERLDGAPWLDSTLTAANGSDTLSPFVRLAA